MSLIIKVLNTVFIYLVLLLFAPSLCAQWILSPDKNVTGRENYYFNTIVVHLELLEDGRFRICGAKQPFSSMHWKNIKPYYLEGHYIENPPGNIVFIDSIDRERYFWVPVGYLANRNANGHPVITAQFSDRQARTFPYSHRFGLISGISPDAIVYHDGSVKYRFQFFPYPFPFLIKAYKKKQAGKSYPGQFGKFKKEMQASSGI